MFLHGAGASSYVLVLRHDGYSRLGERPPTTTPSDELRIYDLERGKLKLRFRFEPAAPTYPSEGTSLRAPGYTFRLGSVRDLDGNGRPEIIGSFETYVEESSPLPLPVVIVWDEEAARYRLSPLFGNPPRLKALPSPGMYAQYSQDEYARPRTLRDVAGSTSIVGHVADFSAVRQGSEGTPVLVGGFTAQSAETLPEVLELKAWILDFQRPQPQTIECFPGTGHEFVSALNRGTSIYDTVVQEFEQRRRAKGFC